MNRHIALPLGLLAVASCTQKKGPNVILIMTDDHCIQAMSCYADSSSEPLVQTPNLDRIATEGMRFDRFYVPNAISGPSRACILTGKFSHVNGFTDNSRTFDGDQPTFPKMLQAAGYQTAMIGKWHLNSTPQGFDYWDILEGQGEYYNPDFISAEGKKTEQGYVTDIITDKTLNFLKTRDKSRPFAVLCYHKAPHRNWMPAPRHLGMNENKVYPEPATLLDDYSGRGTAAHTQEMEIGRNMWPDWDLKIVDRDDMDRAEMLEKTSNVNKDDVSRANDMSNGIRQFKGAYSRMTPEQQDAWDKAYAPRIAEWRAMADTASAETVTRWKFQQYMKDYCAVITAVDESVGQILDYLKKTGELDNTIIIYTSDQGFYLGEHGWFDKRFMYEESFRAPLLVRYPKKIKAGTVSKALGMNIDLAPTILDMAGVSVPSEIQGRSLKPVFEAVGETPEGWRDAVYYHYYEYPSWHSVKRHYGIRTARYKLIHFYNDVDEWELYDMQNDPHELHNVYDAPEYSAVRTAMMARLDSMLVQTGDTDPCEKSGEFFNRYDNLK